MNWLNTGCVLLAAFLVVFWEASFGIVRRLTGAQMDLLPALIVYASLCSGFRTVIVLAVLGGLWLDSLSANPLGVSVLPLITVGSAIYAKRDLILRDQLFAQLALGLAASAAVPPITVLLLLTTGQEPLLGWGSFWQWFVMAIGGAVATPIFFEVFRWIDRTLGQAPSAETSFRPDREIRRGRS